MHAEIKKQQKTKGHYFLKVLRKSNEAIIEKIASMSYELEGEKRGHLWEILEMVNNKKYVSTQW